MSNTPAPDEESDERVSLIGVEAEETSTSTSTSSSGDRLGTTAKLRFAMAIALNAVPTDLVLTQAPFIFQAYYRADALLVGLIGTLAGFYNMANGLPIANAADRGWLNARLPWLFPLETWGRRAPWILLGMPFNSLAGVMVLFPPMAAGSQWLPVWYGLLLVIYFTGHTATTQQF
jgi:Na+/melibiose symporter-like transporter